MENRAGKAREEGGRKVLAKQARSGICPAVAALKNLYFVTSFSEQGKWIEIRIQRVCYVGAGLATNQFRSATFLFFFRFDFHLESKNLPVCTQRTEINKAVLTPVAFAHTGICITVVRRTVLPGLWEGPLQNTLKGAGSPKCQPPWAEAAEPIGSQRAFLVLGVRRMAFPLSGRGRESGLHSLPRQ